MEIIEKQVEKVKEVPYGYGYYDGYGRNVVGKANAGLALGIVGTVLGGAALFGNRRNGLLGVGSNGDGANIAIASCGYAGGNEEQKSRLFQDDDYVETYTKIQNMVNAEILNLVKSRIESTQEGKELLSHQLKTVKRLKSKIIDETNREMEMFRKFREFSKQHPEVTYEEFIKSNM